MQEKLTIIGKSVLVHEKDTSFQGHGEWYVWCYTVLDQSLWIPGVLNDVFVSGLPGLVGLPFIHSGHE